MIERSWRFESSPEHQWRDHSLGRVAVSYAVSGGFDSHSRYHLGREAQGAVSLHPC